MEEKRCSVGEIVIKQGDEGNDLYVVDSGNLTCVRVFVRVFNCRLKGKNQGI